MKIDVKKMKKDYFLLVSLIKKYEDNLLNYYGKMNYVLSEWNDKNGLKFSEHISDEKKRISLLIDSLKAICNLYGYLIKKYEHFGNTLNIDFDSIDEISDIFNQLNDKFDIIVDKYNSLNLDFTAKNKEQILIQKEKTIGMRKDTNNLKREILKKIDTIKRIENDVNYKISKILIENISETVVSDYI